MICVTEPLDLSGASRFLERARRLAQNCSLLIVDLQQADFIDSTGVRALLVLAEGLEAAGKELSVVVRPGSRVERTLSLLQLRERFQCFPTLGAAARRDRALA
jgi:anti-anti-sigma factor